MSRFSICPCGYQGDYPPWSVEYHVKHRSHHLAVYESDEGTVKMLEHFIRLATLVNIADGKQIDESEIN